MSILKSLSQLNLSNWCIGAGIIRDLVWSHLHGLETLEFNDIDVAYFKPGEELSFEKELEKKMLYLRPEIKWDFKNQSNVHLWYEEKFGVKVNPLNSLKEAIGTWPETATSVAVYLENDSSIGIIAPCGLDDLFNIILRRNPIKITEAQFENRLETKGLIEKWPLMKVLRD